MMGGMAPGHITPDLLPELTRMTKPGKVNIFPSFTYVDACLVCYSPF